RLLHRDVVDHRQRLGADAEHVVHVHGDAVDADRVVPVHQLRDQELRAHAVGGNREAGAPDVDDVGEVAEIELDVPEAHRTGRERLAEDLDETLETGLFLVRADAGRGVGRVPAAAGAGRSTGRRLPLTSRHSGEPSFERAQYTSEP